MKLYLVILFSLTASLSQAQFYSLESFAIKSVNYNSPLNYPELYYEIYIAGLNENTQLDLFYDEDVQSYIDLFLTERIEDLILFMERSEHYFPMFETYFSEYNIPEEMKFLAVLESGLSPTAISPSQAVGLWQFKEKTGAHYGLKINEYQDDREDPVLSTIAACKYLNRLNEEFKDWNTTLLAYNAGPSFLRQQLRIAKSNEYHIIYPLITEPAQKYLPALIAIIYLFNNFENHF